jgi:hypothetical protein
LDHCESARTGKLSGENPWGFGIRRACQHYHVILVGYEPWEGVELGFQCLFCCFSSPVLLSPNLKAGDKETTRRGEE